MPRILPWIAAPDDLAEGDVILLGRAAGQDVELTVGEAVRAGTILGVDEADGCLHPVRSDNVRRTRK